MGMEGYFGRKGAEIQCINEWFQLFLFQQYAMTGMELPLECKEEYLQGMYLVHDLFF